MSSITSAFSGMLFERQRARHRSERVAATDVEASSSSVVVNAAATPHTDVVAVADGGSTEQQQREQSVSSVSGPPVVGGGGDSDDDDIERGERAIAAASTTSSTTLSSSSNRSTEAAPASAAVTAVTEGNSDSEVEEDDDEDNRPRTNQELADAVLNASTTTEPQAARAAGNTVSLAELEEERELARRRSSICVLMSVFVLFRLWVEAIQTGDFGLLLLCLVGTSWTARWIRHNREREEEFDRQITRFLERAEPGTTEMDRNDLRMLSFQAQLALAIMESQRQMMQGGHGHPDHDGNNSENAGVSDDAKAQWERFNFKAVAVPPGAADDSKLTTSGKQSKQGRNSSTTRKRGGSGYGSVTQHDDDDHDCRHHQSDPLKQQQNGGITEAHSDDAPHCSICLSEYEDGETVVKLPCSHLYHEECIASWTANHVKCPLCNYDLSSVASSEASSVANSASIV